MSAPAPNAETAITCSPCAAIDSAIPASRSESETTMGCPVGSEPGWCSHYGKYGMNPLREELVTIDGGEDPMPVQSCAIDTSRRVGPASANRRLNCVVLGRLPRIGELACLDGRRVEIVDGFEYSARSVP